MIVINNSTNVKEFNYTYNTLSNACLLTFNNNLLPTISTTPP